MVDPIGACDLIGAVTFFQFDIRHESDEVTAYRTSRSSTSTAVLSTNGEGMGRRMMRVVGPFAPKVCELISVEPLLRVKILVLVLSETVLVLVLENGGCFWVDPIGALDLIGAVTLFQLDIRHESVEVTTYRTRKRRFTHDRQSFFTPS